MAEDKVTNLYNAFVKNGYAMEPEAQFRENLKDPKKRKAAYDALVADGYNMEPFADFESNIGFGAPTPAPAPTAPTPQQQAQPAATAAPTSVPASATAEEQEQAPVQSQPEQAAWQPSEQEKIRMSYQMHTMLNDFKQKSKARIEQVQRMTEPLTPEGRKKLKAAKFQAQLAGTPTKVMGLTPPTSAPASDGAEGAAEDEAQQQPVRSGQSPVPYGVKYIDGKAVTQWLLPDGRLTTNYLEADQAEYGARTVRLRNQFVGRMKENGLDPAKQEDVQKQAQLDYEAPMRKVLSKVWAQAEAEDREADEEYTRQLKEYNNSVRSNIRAYGPDGMPLPTPEENIRDYNRAVKRKETFNLEKMAESVYAGLPSSYRNSQLHAYQQYFSTHTNELNGRTVQSAAEEALKGEVYQAVYQHAVDSRMPKSKTEFFLRKLADQPFVSTYQAMDMAASAMTGSYGMTIADQAAMSQYGQEHRVLDIIGTIGNMAIDPTTYISGGVGSAAGKQALKIAGKQMIKGATKDMAERFATRTLTGRLVQGAAGGAFNFATYETLKNLQQQASTGGMPDYATGTSNGFSGQDLLNATKHGFIMGGIVGTASPIIGNVADKAVKVTTSTAGKMAVRGGEVAVSTLAEGTIFSIPEWISGERDAMDVWTDNMAMMLGFKAQHGLKSAPRVIAGLRPIKPTEGRPLTQAERTHNRMNFEERLRKNMDASPNDLSFTADEREELRRTGYGELADLFSRDRVQDVQRSDIDPAEGAIELRAERVEAETISRNPEFDGYSAMEELMQDGRVSQAARAKAYYILTGRMLPMGTVTGYTTTTTEDGRVTVSATTADGEIVTTRTFKNEQESKQETDNIMRQAELNSVDVGERFKEAVADDMVLDAAISEVSPGADPATIKKIYRAVKAGNKDVTESQVQLAEFLDDAIARNKDIADKYRPEAIREALKEETGIDVDAVLRKKPSKRTEAEQEAVKSYLERLFPEEARQQNADPTPEQAEAQNRYEQGRLLYGRFEEGDPTVQADVDAIALRMQEAYQAVEDAFGAEAEYYMFHVNENPWALVNDPELTAEQQDAVLYYINAKAALDGVMDASNEAADRKRAEVEQSVGKRTHKDNGIIIPATMKVDDRQVYVVKGDVVMFPDGSAVDVRNSSESVVVMDAQTGEYEFTSPDQIFQVSEAVNPQDELDTALSVIEQEQMSVFGQNAVAPEEPAEGEAPIDQSADVSPEPAHETASTEEYDRGYEQGLEEAAKADDAWIANLIKIYSQNTPESMPETMKGRLDAFLYEQQRRAQSVPETPENVPNPTENAVSDAEITPETVSSVENGQQTALSRIPLNEQGEPRFEAVDKDTAWDGLVEAVGGETDAVDIAMAQIQQASTDLEALKKKPPTLKAPKLKGSPMAMVQAKREAAEQYQRDLAQYNQQIADTEARLATWNGIVGVYNSRNAELRRQQEEERRQRDAIAHDEAVARFEEEQRIKAEKKAEQERIGVHAVNPKIREKWDSAPKVEGHTDAITLPDGSIVRGRYVLTEAGAASASHDVNNAYMPTEGFPIDENGQSVNDRDYMRDNDAQRIVEQMAGAYDNRALQNPVIVSKDGVVLSGNNRTMSGDLAARQGTDKAYVDYLREFGHKYGFTLEQVQGMSNPRLVFVPDENLPYDATTFSRFNAQEMKSQSKPEAAVKLGKIVPDNVFTDIANDISRYDRLSDYYADEKAVAHALGALMQAGVINDKQMPEMRTGTALSAAGKELIENTLIGKVFQTSPDAVRQIISMPTLRQSIVMGLNEIANNRTLARNGYDISEELAKAVDLVTRAKTAMPDVYTDGMPVSPFGRMQGLFDDEFGDSRVTDATALLLADILNSGKPSDLRKVLTSYNNEAAQASGGQLDMFSGSIPSKEEILTNVNEHFRNATPKEQQALVEAAIAERKRRTEAEAEQLGRDQESEQTPNDVERSAEPQQPVAGTREELTPEEQALAARVEITENDWEEGDSDKPTYKREIIIDGTHIVTQVDAPNEDGHYTGSYFEFDGKRFGDIAEIAQYIDGHPSAELKVDGGMQSEPTEAQKAAGNYKMEHRKVDGYNVSIENAKGSVRRGTGADGKSWETTMQNDYGYIRGTQGVDGDHIDVFLSDTPEEGDVFVVDQVNEDGSFDEHKVMYGFPTEQAARDAYLSNYEQGWTGLGAITHVSKEEFKKWIGSSKRKTKPFANYKSVKPKEDNSMVGRSLSEQEVTDLIAKMEANAEVAPAIELTPENWIAQFGEDGTVKTPIGIVKMGANQLLKLYSLKRTEYFGMIHPTLNSPDVILEEADPKEGSERDSKYLFIKTFVKSDGTRIVHFESVTVKKDGMEVSISSHEIKDKSLKNKMQNDIVLHLDEKLSPSSEMRLTETPSESEGPDLVPTSDNVSSDGKDNTLSADKQTNGAGSSEPYTITPTTYTNKKGKTSDVHLVKFNRELTKEEKSALDTFVREPLAEGKKTSRGWYDRKQGGYMMRSEEAARQLGEMLGNEEAVADVQPMTAEEPQAEAYHGTVTLKDGREAVVIAANHVQNIGEPPRLTDYIVGVKGEPGTIKISPEEIAHAGAPTVEDKPSTPAKSEETHNGYKVGDEVMWDRYGNGNWEKVKIEDFDTDGRPIFEAVKGVMSEKGDWSRVKPADGIFGEAQRVARATQEKKRSSRKKDVTLKPEQPVGDLFGGLFDNTQNSSNHEETEMGTRPGEAGGQRQQFKQDTQVGGDEPRRETERPAGEAGSGSTGMDSDADRAGGRGLHDVATQPALDHLPEKERKNVHNNHVERGTEVAPKSESARIKANIAAIETMKKLEASGEAPTAADMKKLRAFSGWGGLGKAFSDWDTSRQLRQLLGDKLYDEGAEMSRNSAYFTPAYIVDAMWDIARAMGFKGGRVLEGSAGIGNVLGLMPQELSERSYIRAVEKDPTTGKMLSLLYPDAVVDIDGFEKVKIETGSYDLVITNVPFVPGLKVADTSGDGDISKEFKTSIHDFCIAKNVRKLRDGGVGVFITTAGSMDGTGRLHKWLSNRENADIVGMFRMHNETFGGTNATSDIIVVRKRVNGVKSPNAIDCSLTTGVRTAEYDTGEKKKVKNVGEVPIIKTLSMSYNRYYVEHPEYMAGEMHFGFEKGDTSFRPESKGLYPIKEKDQSQLLSQWVEDMKQKLADTSEEPAPTVMNHRDEYVPTYDKVGNEVKTGTVVVDSQGRICVNYDGTARPLMSKLDNKNPKSADERIAQFNKNKVKGRSRVQVVQDYNAIKKALNDLLEYQKASDSDEGLQPKLKALNRAFDSFVATYGHLHGNNGLAWLKNDVDYPSVIALETYREEGLEHKKVFGKADIFSRRVVVRPEQPKATNVRDGVTLSIRQTGSLDTRYIADQLGMSEADVRREVIEAGLGYENPLTHSMEAAHEYLSGNVREKMQQAEVNNEDGRYTPNITALRKVVPHNIPSHFIEFSIGSSWLRPELFEQYVKERTGASVKLTYAGGMWAMDKPKWTGEQDKSFGIRSEICDKIITGTELIEAAMTNRTIRVSKQQKDGPTISDPKATSACAAKVDEIRDDFKSWLRSRMESAPELAKEIEETYNNIFNNSAPMTIPDEYIPEYFDGAARVIGGTPIKMREHQSKAIVRGTMQSLMLAHEVGTGKTFTLITTAMEMRRLGTAKKPMIVVQNATLGQFVASAKALYPDARILSLEDKDRNAEGRKDFYAKIRYNDWDMVVIPQSVLERIPDHPDRERRFIEESIQEKMDVIEAMSKDREAGRAVAALKKDVENLRDQLNKLSNTETAEGEVTERVMVTSGSKPKKDGKRAAIAKENAKTRAEEMLNRATDDTLNFDDLGVDAILVDEAHEYKHLGFATAMQRGVKGVDPSYSKKCQGLYLKVKAVQEKSGGRNVIFATGTPISNTAAEVWTFMRYLLPREVMEGHNIWHFDDFVRNFGSIQQMLEFTTQGTYKENNRFAGYSNLPELARIWAGITDTVLTAEAGEVKSQIPELEGGQPTDLYLPQSIGLRAVLKFVRAQLKAYDEMSGQEKKENSHIPLVMYGIAKAAAIDARLVMANAPDDPHSKTNEAVRQTLRSLEDSKAYNGTVAIFADNYQRKNKGTGAVEFNLFDDIRTKLIAQGVPAEQVVIMRDGMTDKAKEKIFAKVNAGEIRVILGTTQRLGVGVNIQERLHTLMHIDAPNRPMDYWQRMGRLLRQGNMHKEMGIPVRVIRFGVEDSLDVTAYQRLKTKGAIADAIMHSKDLLANNLENRILEEEGDEFGNITAELSGSQYAMLQNQTEKELRKLQAKQDQHRQHQMYIHRAEPRLRERIEKFGNDIMRSNEILALLENNPTTITINGKTYQSREDMQKVFEAHNKAMAAKKQSVQQDEPITSTLTFDIGNVHFTLTTHVSQIAGYGGQGALSFDVDVQHDVVSHDIDYKRSFGDIPLKRIINELVDSVTSGKEERSNREAWVNAKERNETDLAALLKDKGKPFEHGERIKELEQKLEEYTIAMQEELREKEAKYAEMDANIEDATDITFTSEDDEDSEDTPTNGDGNKYREDDDIDYSTLSDSNPMAMEARISELSKKVHTPVRIIRSLEELNEITSHRKRNAKGWWSAKDNEVVIVLPNNVNVADVDNTFVHEVAGHKGLRAFIGEERFNEFLGEVYNHASNPIRKVIDKKTDDMVNAEADRLRVRKAQARERAGEDVNSSYYADMAEARVEAEAKREEFRKEATEEYMSELGGRIGSEGFEKMSRDELTLWGKIKAKVQSFLDKFLRGLKIAKSIRLNDKDLSYILYKSWKNLRDKQGKGGVFAEAEDVVMRRRTGYDADDVTRFRDPGLGLEETITKMKAEALQANTDNLQAKRDAMRAIGGNLDHLRQAMARQREYDITTVKSVADLARILMDANLLDDLSKYETKRILGAINNVVGKQDVSRYVQKVMDIMVDNQLRMGANTLGRLLSIRGSHVDARGIEVQGELDPDGQRIAQVVRKATSLPKDNIDIRIAEAINRMSSTDQAIADDATIEYAGLQIARQYVEDITESKAEEKALRDSIKQAKEDKDAGQMTEDAYRQYVASTEDAIRQNKIERAEAFHSLVEQVGGVLNESVERAKAWREAEKQRVEEIHHNANSDMEGRPTDEHHKDDRTQKLANNSGVRFLLAPLATFDQMLRMFGKKNTRGEGYLWNRYMRGWVSATEKEYTGYRDALKVLDAKVSEIYGKDMKWGDLFSIDRKLPKASVRFFDGGEMKDHELTQGNLLYIYMADKMSDGRMKLRRMGITEEDIEDIKNFLDPKFIQLADWMQEEFLVDKRNEYNEVHKRMFGASMAAIENYFPLKILANARLENVDVADDTTDTALPATSTGSIIKRRRNNLALDVTGANAFSVILDHLQQMERWAAFAEFNRDLNTLLSYKRFRNQVMNMSSVYGGGKTLWNNFRNVCSMAAGAYRPPIAALDKSAVNIAKGVTAAKVSFRMFTALKQFLSIPAYISDSNPMYLAANIANPIGAWRWSMKNLPLFEKRWRSRMAGDPRLLKSDMDWKMWRSRIVEIASRVGMSLNAFVDALTVAIGSRSMYQTKLAKYKRQGYDHDVAEARAKQDATILFNQTQQSSEGAFLSTMQVDRSWLSLLFTVFRNSPMSYTRQLYDSIRNLGHRFTPGYKGLSEEFMAKQMRRDGIDPDKADRNAKQEYRRGIIRDLVRVGVFGYVLQLAWNLCAYLPYLILGEDDEEKDKMWQDVWNHSMFGSIEGLTGGDVISAAGNMWVSGEGNPQYLTKDMPLASDVLSILKKMDKDQVSAMNDVINLLVQSIVGVNPQSLTDAVVAVMDYCGDDAETSRECALLMARVLNCPQSQLDKIYFDELDASGEEASQMTPSEIAERYARYKVRRGAPLTGWAYGNEQREKLMDKYRDRSNTLAKKRLTRETDKQASQNMAQWLEEFEATKDRVKEIRKVKSRDEDRYDELLNELEITPEYDRYEIIKGYKRDVDALTKDWLNATTPAQRDSCAQAIIRLKSDMVRELINTQQ